MENLTFTFTKQEADTMIQALGEMPFKLTAGLISNLQNQFQQQAKPVEKITAEEVK